MTILNSFYLEKKQGFKLNKKIYLNFRNKSITVIEKDAFISFSSITWLILSNNEISHIAEQAFHPLVNLEKLRLNNNNLHSIPENAFILANNLTGLDLSANQITHIPVQAFHPLVKLQELHLHDNKLTSIPSEAFVFLHNLTILSLDNNHIVDIHKDTFTPLDSNRIALVSLYNNNSCLKAMSFYDKSKANYLDRLYLKKCLFGNEFTKVWSQFLNQFKQLSTKWSFTTVSILSECLLFLNIYLFA